MNPLNHANVNFYYTNDYHIIPITCTNCFKEFITSHIHSGEHSVNWPAQKEKCLFICPHCDTVFNLIYMGYDWSSPYAESNSKQFVFYFSELTDDNI